MSAAEGAPSEVYSTAEREGGEGAGNAAGRTTESQGAAAAGGGGASCRSTSPRAAPGCGGPESPADPSASPENSNNSNGRYVTFCDVLKNIRYVTSHPCNVSFVTCNDGVTCNVKSPDTQELFFIFICFSSPSSFCCASLYFLSREGSSSPFPSSTVEANYPQQRRSLLLGVM